MTSYKRSFTQAAAAAVAMSVGATDANADGGRGERERSLIASTDVHTPPQGSSPEQYDGWQADALQLSHMFSNNSNMEILQGKDGTSSDVTAENLSLIIVTAYAPNLVNILKDPTSELLVNPDSKSWSAANDYQAFPDGSFAYNQKDPLNARPLAALIKGDTVMLLRAKGEVELYAKTDPALVTLAPWVTNGTAIDIRQAFEALPADKKLTATAEAPEVDAYWQRRAKNASGIGRDEQALLAAGGIAALTGALGVGWLARRNRDKPHTEEGPTR